MHLELKLLSVPHICEPIINSAAALDQYPHLNSLELTADFELPNQIVPDVLLGSDQHWSLLRGEVIKGNTGPTALSTHLGWILSGPAQVKEALVSHSTFVTHVLLAWNDFKQRSRERVTHSFWSLQSRGITEDKERVQGQFARHVSFQNGRYVVALPWRDSCLPLPSNYKLSLRRLNSLFRRLKAIPDLQDKYDAIIREQIEQGILVYQ